MQDPGKYLAGLHIELPCPVRRGRMATLDSTFRACVNHEVYFFSSHDAKERFVRRPLQYCGVVTDPVSAGRFRPDRRSPRFDFGGRPYFFTSDSTLAIFKATPDRFAVRRGA